MKPGLYLYEIRVAETLDERWSKWFDEMEIISTTDQTGSGSLLRGRLPDQTGLFGILSRIRDLNLTLIEVRRVNPFDAPTVLEEKESRK